VQRAHLLAMGALEDLRGGYRHQSGSEAIQADGA